MQTDPGSIYHSGEWTGGGSYSIVVNGPRAWKTYPHLFSFIIGTYQAMILRGIILFEFLFYHCLDMGRGSVLNDRGKCTPPPRISKVMFFLNK